MTERSELTEQELSSNEATQLPDREVMSLIATDPTTGMGAESLLPAYDTSGTTGPAGGATGAADPTGTPAGEASTIADADGSATEGDATPVSEDRHETFSSSDSASAIS
jgi:hypothetical protein